MVRVTKKLIAAREVFALRFIAIMEAAHAIAVPDPAGSPRAEFVLVTPIGNLDVTIFEDWIATRFENERAGYAFTRYTGNVSNQYSGKWNWHYGDDIATLTAETVAVEFGVAIDRLLAYVPSVSDLDVMRDLTRNQIARKHHDRLQREKQLATEPK
jgi:hypothetical protein